MKTALAVTAAVLALASAAIAATGGTPAQMRAELLSPTLSLRGATAYGAATIGNAPIRGNVQMKAAACRGLGKPSKGEFAVFTCSLTWLDRSSGSTSSLKAWVRPWTSTVACVTTMSVGACPPAPPTRPLPGDPRACSTGSPQPYVQCIVQAAGNAAQAKLNSENINTENYGCQATTAFVYRCSGTGGSNPLTVTFTAGKTSWTTSVTG